jgi:hypothetical protein
MTLAEFLLARIAEDEAVARQAHVWTAANQLAADREIALLSGPSLALAVRVLPRVLAECDAKRELIEYAGELAEIVDELDVARSPGLSAVVLLAQARILGDLALPFADHPDYREEWKP